MFARKGKSSDIQASIARFTDLNRDCVSRVKHLKILLDTLTTNEKKQLLDEHSFETFHLVDELLLVNDVSTQIDSAIEAESGLWTLEQVLCLAPELVGSGWQRHAIESLLKKAIFPKNLMAVRKIAIRLFLVFYQCLGVYGKATPDLDRVFQSLLPFFPLKSGENTDDVLAEYCQSSGSGDWIERLRNGPIRQSSGIGGNIGLSSKERAQTLQVYLDKFLEYCTRETVRIEWNDEDKRTHCANFIIEKVIKLYMGECFDELESNGVDVFGGWEGAEEPGDPLDTADPVVISRYWLIRWINNIASATQNAQNAHPSLLLYRNALFSSQKATNVALTLMREAMVLPLACSNVTHKVVNVLSTWLLQYEIPPFVASGEVSVERSSLLLANILLSFFHSPYLTQCGEKLSSAVSIAFLILTSCKQLVAHRIQLPKPLPQKFWAELMVGLCSCANKICSQTENFAQQVSAAFTSTLISNAVIIKAVRRIEIDDEVWDEVHAVMKKGVWITMAEQWATVVNSVTRALILHLAHVDLFSREEALRKATDSSVISQARRQAVESMGTMMEEPRNQSTEGGDSMTSASTNVEDNVFHDTDDITNAVTSWSGDKLAWLQTWRRVISLVDPYLNPSANVAIDCISTAIRNLLSVNLHPLAHWLACRLVTVPVALLPRCVPALSAILCESTQRRPPPLLSANILLCFIRLMQSKDQTVVPAICSLSAQELSIVAPRALEHLPKMLTVSKGGTKDAAANSLKLFAMLSSTYPGAEQVLLDQLSQADTADNAVVIVNTLAMLIVQRAQIELVFTVMKSIEAHQFAVRLLPLFCSSISALAQFSSPTILKAMLRAATLLRDERARTEVEWQMVKLCVQWPQQQIPMVIRGILADRHAVLQGELITMAGQYPLKGFEVSRWNSLESGLRSTLGTQEAQEKTVYVNRTSSIVSISRKTGCDVTCRTVVGRHIWQLDTVDEQRTPFKNLTNWLKKEAAKGKKAGRDAQGILGAMDDPFDELPSSENSTTTSDVSPIEGSAQFAAMIESSRRQPQAIGNANQHEVTKFQANTRLLEWRSLSASLGFVPAVSSVHPNFQRDLKHLDQTSSREVHKIAVIYVGDGQEDRASILSNTSASEDFEDFVQELGWEVKIGNRTHDGYNGGLPVDTRAPYYADAESEVIFHVSTWLSGDVHQKWKHIGNDEVHIVWTENSRKPYTRETIATKFCDVLIVLENVGDKMIRVRVDTASALEFGPLFDGALVAHKELATFVRLTVINASRAYRLARVEHSRPLRHREEVFCNEALAHMKSMSLAKSINHLYVPTI